MKSFYLKVLAVAGAIVLSLWVFTQGNRSSSPSEGKFFNPKGKVDMFEGHPEPLLMQKNFHVYTDPGGNEYFSSINRSRNAIVVQPLNGDPYFTIRPDSFYTPDSTKQALNLLYCHKIVSWDSIFVIDRGGTNIYMCNRNGNITSVWNVTQTTCDNGPFELRSYSFSAIQLIDNSIYVGYLPYPPTGRQYDIFSCNTIAKITLPEGGGNTRISTIFGPYSSTYKNPRIAYGRDGYIPSFTLVPYLSDRSFLLSFPKDHQLYRVNERKMVRPHAGKSNEVREFKPYDGNLNDIIGTGKYSVEEPRYWNLMYDSHRELFYRVVLHRQSFGDGVRVRQFHEKPWSIMVFDKNFRKLGEQTFPAQKFFPKDIFVGKNGLYVSNATVEVDGVVPKTLSFTLFEVNPKAL